MPDRPRSPRTLRPKVLIVEDDESIRAALVDALQQTRPDLNVESTETAERALDLARRAFADHEPFALVVSDHRMAKMTGAELLATLEREQLIHAGILASATDRAESELRERGSTSLFLAKPYRIAELLELIERALGF